MNTGDRKNIALSHILFSLMHFLWATVIRLCSVPNKCQYTCRAQSLKRGWSRCHTDYYCLANLNVVVIFLLTARVLSRNTLSERERGDWARGGGGGGGRGSSLGSSTTYAKVVRGKNKQ